MKYGDDRPRNPVAPCLSEKGREQRKEREERYRRYYEAWLKLNSANDRTWTPWLVIRHGGADVGLRPMPEGIAHYRSPDIWVESSDANGRAVAGERNFIHARVFNLGRADAAPTKVDFYWADPSLGLGPANMNLVGTEWVEVPAGSSVDVRCSAPWVPVHVNGGHECLKVNTDCPILDPINEPFRPRLDRHAGQRNITVVEAAAGEEVGLPLAINNLWMIPVKVEIAFQIEAFAVSTKLLDELGEAGLVRALTAGPAETWADLAKRYRPDTRPFRTAQGVARRMRQAGRDELGGMMPVGIDRLAGDPGTLSVRVNLSDDRRFVRPSQPEHDLAATIEAAGQLVSATGVPPGFSTVLGLTLEPYEQRRIRVSIARGGEGAAARRIATFHLCHLAQWNDRHLVGGYTVVLRSPTTSLGQGA